jgi:putative Mg2+ transporter-C (MgtC) family protein
MEATFTLDIAVALVLGLAIGLERQIHQHPAGLRTNALVCVGAAMFVSISRLLEPEGSMTRVAAQVVSGIGFLGGGVILREGLTVRGMTTAATLWCSAAVGTLAGVGYPLMAAIGTVFILATNAALRPVSQWIDSRSKGFADVETGYRLTVVCPSHDEAVIRTILMRHVNSHASMLIQGIGVQSADESGMTKVVVDIHSSVRDDRNLQEVVSRINIEPSIRSASWERLR